MFGVELICRVLQMAPSCYWRHTARRRNPQLRNRRARQDDRLANDVQRVWHANWQVYGADKVWLQMNREGFRAARCLMKRLGLEGAHRGRKVRTTMPDTSASCPLDRVNRVFRAQRPDDLWVSDFTYVATWQGWLYVAFVIDVFARRIVGWRVSRPINTSWLQVLRRPVESTQYLPTRYSERLAEACIRPSVGQSRRQL